MIFTSGARWFLNGLKVLLEQLLKSPFYWNRWSFEINRKKFKIWKPKNFPKKFKFGIPDDFLKIHFIGKVLWFFKKKESYGSSRKFLKIQVHRSDFTFRKNNFLLNRRTLKRFSKKLHFHGEEILQKKSTFYGSEVFLKSNLKTSSLKDQRSLNTNILDGICFQMGLTS